jgi:hypothetical protein
VPSSGAEASYLGIHLWHNLHFDASFAKCSFDSGRDAVKVSDRYERRVEVIVSAKSVRSAPAKKLGLDLVDDSDELSEKHG